MQCGYFDAGVCRSCDLMGIDEGRQLADKVADCRALLGDRGVGARWLDPMASAPAGFRNKAKMVVGGRVDDPTLGILDAGRHGVDLTGCGVVADGIRSSFPAIREFIAQARLTPYDVPQKRGELKHVLVSEAPDGALMVRFVLRSSESILRIRKHLPSLQAALPRMRVASVNLQPEHKAVLEGPEEIVLTQQQTLAMRMRMPDAGPRELVLEQRPGGFFQTNTPIAAGLYAQAAAWIDEVAPASVWDLYCGVGGFALAAAGAGRSVVGVEVSEAAVVGAETARDRAGLGAVRFLAADAMQWAREQPAAPDAVIVNPPRRGLGADLADWLEGSGAPTIVYSSCNAVTLVTDLQRMPSYRVDRVRVFDMFPQTRHYEAMVLLRSIG